MLSSLKKSKLHWLMYTTCEERFLKTSKLMYMILHYFLSFLVYCTCQSKLFQHSPDAI